MHHHLHLHPEPFEKIASGQKVIECRLYDDKRKLIQLGDIMTFISRADESTIDTTVIGLLRYPTFNDMFKDLHERFFGHAPLDQLTASMATFYSHEEEQTD